MVTSVSTDRGRRQRLQSKSHIQAPAPISMLPNTRAGKLAFLLSCAEQRRKDRERSYPLIFLCRCLACEKNWRKSRVLKLSYSYQPFHQIDLRTKCKGEQLKRAHGVKDKVLRTPLSLPFVIVQLLSPLPTFSVPVQFTPYNSLKVFDISKHTGVADVAGPRPQRQLLYQPVCSMGCCTDKVRIAVLMPLAQ